MRFCPALKVAGSPVVIHVLEGKEDIPEFVNWIRSHKRFGLDTETSGLDYWNDSFKLRLIQFGTRDTAYVVPVEVSEDLWGAAVGAIRDICRRGGKLAFQNAPYDLLVLDAKTELRMEDIWPHVVDSKILGHLVDSRAAKEGGTGHSLEDLTRAYIDEEVATKIKGSMAELAKSMKTTKGEVFKNIDTWHPGYLLYSGLDPILSFRLARRLGPLVPTTARKLIAFEHRVAEICSYMSRRGVRLDIAYTKALIQRLYADELEWTAIARELGCGNPWATEQAADAFEARGVVIESRTPSGRRKVDKVFLEERVKQGDLLAKAIEQAKSARKKRTTWLEGFLEAVDSNGYIHPWINSIQARTARMSITGIPAQTLPSGDWEIRRCFLADEGHVIGSIDYKAQELRVLAALADEKRMKAAFLNEEDLHQITADAAGVSRKIGKMANFLTVYGGGVKALVQQAGVTEEVADKTLKAFMDTFPAVKKLSDNLTAKARRDGYITTPSGRRLYVDKGRAYSAVNYMVQSTSRDVTCRALVRLHEAGFTPYLLLPIHDEVVATIPANKAEWGTSRIGKIMEETLKGVHVGTDPEYGKVSWGSLYGAAE
ncbi:DNA polymerase [Streptomyces sp. NRRL F-6602]|nr:DNA polymerase [Streptomyces sp. NRRL F-6602]